MNILPIIMAGGSGTRLWPLSRTQYPKQFLSLNSQATMLQETCQRLAGLSIDTPIVVCSEDHRFLAAEQLRVIGYEQAKIILEPQAKNTAPAIALAATVALQQKQDPILMVLSADHLIKDIAQFHESIQAALPLAEAGKLVTFGVIPTHAETGYGYIEQGNARDKGFDVARFVEKPDQATAQQYLDSKKYLWNSGMFMFKASRYLEELAKFANDIKVSCEKATATLTNDQTFIRIIKDEFALCPSDSIDYAVMEKTEDAVVVPLDADWSDIGSWSALWDVSAKDENGNVLQGDVIAHNSQNVLVHSTNRLVSVVGLKDVIVVETKDAVLVVHKDQVQDVKKAVEKLKAEGRNEHLNHREVLRPWGVYDSVDSGERYQVKRITVNPGAKLSVQMHYHRAEHWIVVSGTARITNGEKTYLLTENQSTYIPSGEIHALENPGKIPLELIEVQSGTYLGEDDIVRFEDKYGRV